MHRSSALCLGFAAAAALLVGPGAGFAAEDGAALFKKYCVECHAPPQLDQNKIGPSLHHVVGRHAGKAPGFGYSSANLNSKIVWTEDKLDAYLTNPKATVPARSSHPGGPLTGTDMTFKGIKDAGERQAVIAFLKAN